MSKMDEVVRDFFGEFVDAGGTLDASAGGVVVYRRAFAAIFRKHVQPAIAAAHAMGQIGKIETGEEYAARITKETLE
jgi:hypothetical protein